jgi:hypothetical protein
MRIAETGALSPSPAQRGRGTGEAGGGGLPLAQVQAAAPSTTLRLPRIKSGVPRIVLLPRSAGEEMARRAQP